MLFISGPRVTQRPSEINRQSQIFAADNNFLFITKWKFQRQIILKRVRHTQRV